MENILWNKNELMQLEFTFSTLHEELLTKEIASATADLRMVNKLLHLGFKEGEILFLLHETKKPVGRYCIDPQLLKLKF